LIQRFPRSGVYPFGSGRVCVRKIENISDAKLVKGGSRGAVRFFVFGWAAPMAAA